MEQANYDIDVQELSDIRANGNAHTVLDIREPEEVDICALSESLTIPMQQVLEDPDVLPREHPLIVVCHHGVRSALVAEILRQNGFENAWNLAGGIDAWSRMIDRDMPRY